MVKNDEAVAVLGLGSEDGLKYYSIPPSFLQQFLLL
jgi:hypothetical protein